MNIIISALFFLALLSILNFLILFFISKKKKENLGYVFLISSTLKTISFFLFIEYYLFKDVKIDYNTKVIISIIFLFSLVIDVYITSKLLKR